MAPRYDAPNRLRGCWFPIQARDPLCEGTRLTMPAGIVVGFAVGAAAFALGRKLVVDKNIRLARQGPGAREDHGEHH